MARACNGLSDQNPSLANLSEPITPMPSASGGSELASEIYCPICLDSLAQLKKDNRKMHSTICGHLVKIFFFILK